MSSGQAACWPPRSPLLCIALASLASDTWTEYGLHSFQLGYVDKFAVGEVIETHPVGGAVYPTLACVNHSCDPNITLVNFGKKAVALAVRQIKAGAEINDSYGAVYHHMDKAERQQFLQVGKLKSHFQTLMQKNRLAQNFSITKKSTIFCQSL